MEQRLNVVKMEMFPQNKSTQDSIQTLSEFQPPFHPAMDRLILKFRKHKKPTNQNNGKRRTVGEPNFKTYYKVNNFQHYLVLFKVKHLIKALRLRIKKEIF